MRALPWKAKLLKSGEIRYPGISGMCPVEAVNHYVNGDYKNFLLASEALHLSVSNFLNILRAADGDETKSKRVINLRKFFIAQTRKRKK
jgi:hypothetical protein